MHTAVTASNTAATRSAVAMRERAPASSASSAAPARRLLIARPPIAPWTPDAISADREDVFGGAKHAGMREMPEIGVGQDGDDSGTRLAALMVRLPTEKIDFRLTIV
jgi:hypothetical protein